MSSAKVIPEHFVAAVLHPNIMSNGLQNKNRFSKSNNFFSVKNVLNLRYATHLMDRIAFDSILISVSVSKYSFWNHHQVCLLIQRCHTVVCEISLDNNVSEVILLSLK